MLPDFKIFFLFFCKKVIWKSPFEGTFWGPTGGSLSLQVPKHSLEEPPLPSKQRGTGAAPQARPRNFFQIIMVYIYFFGWKVKIVNTSSRHQELLRALTPAPKASSTTGQPRWALILLTNQTSILRYNFSTMMSRRRRQKYFLDRLTAPLDGCSNILHGYLPPINPPITYSACGLFWYCVPKQCAHWLNAT